jgi:DNA mismatch repair protein MutL
MNRIRLLSEQVANQIAAGEVVERPASVVKELVENALDAKATRITVEIQAGGRSLIRVTDDGIGMSRDDALLSLERHATSKIQSAADLSSIATMGFRGEALPSITSVSRATLTTRERDSESPEGSRIIINGGKIIEVKAAGATPGTCIEIRQLFFNVPARRKFLRSEETERAHIQHYLTLVALAHPEIAFTVLQDDRITSQLPAVEITHSRKDQITALRERFQAVYGAELPMTPVDFSTLIEAVASEDADVRSPAEQMRVWGLIGAPGVSRGTREDQHVFVNRRPIENRGINYALSEGYHNALMKGRFPVCCLFLEINPASVDVNIHPSKREVKFHHEMAIRRIVAQAVRDALAKFHSAQHKPGLPSVSVQAVIAPQQSPSELPKVPSDRPETQPDRQPIRDWPKQDIPRVPVERETPAQTLFQNVVPPPLPGSATSPQAAASDVGKPIPLLHVPLRLLGVVGKLYVLLESDRGLVLMDQHAAHERVLFEQLLARLEQGTVPSQRLLLPETVELASRDAQFLKQQITPLVRLGIGLSEFGERTFLLDALPPFIKAVNPRLFVLQLIDDLKATGQEVNSWRLGEEMIAKKVCRHAVKANDALALPELEKLIVDLRHCTMPYTCPHGRPTIIEMNYRELERRFGRVQ